VLFDEFVLGAFPNFQEAFVIKRKLGDNIAHAISNALALRDSLWFTRLVSGLATNVNMLGYWSCENLVI
jgi:hypothetical protein